jgi:hypothetical protein
MFRSALAVLATGATAGSLGLTWEDCGDSATHGKTTDVQPSSIVLGEETDIVGSGSIDKDVSGGTYDLHMTAGGGLINKHFTGNNCEAKTFNLPLGIGQLGWGGLTCPQAAGGVELHFVTTLSASLPASLATSKIGLTAIDTTGDDLLCINLNLKKESEVSLDAEGPGGIVHGLLKGLLADSTNFKNCAGDLGTIRAAVKSVFADIKTRKIGEVFEDISKILIAMKPAMETCGQAAGDLKVFMKIMEGVKTPGDLSRKLKKNLLDNDEKILGELEKMGKVCTFAEPDGFKCGENLGKIIRQVVVGANHMELELAVQNGNIVSGLLKGLLGDSKDFKACAGSIGDVTNVTKTLVTDIRQRHVKHALHDVSDLLMALKPAFEKCGRAAGDFKVFLKLFEGVKTPADLYQKIRRNLLDNDEKMLDELAEMGKVCTFAAPSAYKCGLNMGMIVRQIVVGVEAAVLV